LCHMSSARATSWTNRLLCSRESSFFASSSEARLHHLRRRIPEAGNCTRRSENEWTRALLPRSPSAFSAVMQLRRARLDISTRRDASAQMNCPLTNWKVREGSGLYGILF
jgi:hypothetical protein